MARLGNLAQLVRSKNAGPLALTFDILFADAELYRRIKATIPRPVPSGDPADTDVYGGQQFAPILDVEVPL